MKQKNIQEKYILGTLKNVTSPYKICVLEDKFGFRLKFLLKNTIKC